MTAAVAGPMPPAPRRFSIRLPGPLWIGLTGVVLGTAYSGIYWHFYRTGPVYERGGINYSLDVERALVRAKLHNKPVLSFFTAVNSVNCRKLLATSICIVDESEFNEFLDAALAAWHALRTSGTLIPTNQR